MIFVNDHAPAHVHVFGDGEAKIEITGDDDWPRVIYAEDMSAAVQRRAVSAIARNRAMLLLKWTEIHDRAD